MFILLSLVRDPENVPGVIDLVLALVGLDHGLCLFAGDVLTINLTTARIADHDYACVHLDSFRRYSFVESFYNLRFDVQP